MRFTYECSDGVARVVEYVNLPDNDLALVEAGSSRRLFVGVIAASGAKYAPARRSGGRRAAKPASSTSQRATRRSPNANNPGKGHAVDRGGRDPGTRAVARAGRRHDHARRGATPSPADGDGVGRRHRLPARPAGSAPPRRGRRDRPVRRASRGGEGKARAAPVRGRSRRPTTFSRLPGRSATGICPARSATGASSCAVIMWWRTC